MKRSQLDALKASILARKEKASDLDIIVMEIMKLPCGQLRKVLTDDVMEVLEKYGYSE